MRPTRTQPTIPPGAVGEWRRRRLIVAGFDDCLAARLAGGDGGVDLHELLVLIDRGCPPALAARILAPLDQPQP